MPENPWEDLTNSDSQSSKWLEILIIEKHADPNIVDEEGMSPLHYEVVSQDFIHDPRSNICMSVQQTTGPQDERET